MNTLNPTQRGYCLAEKSCGGNHQQDTEDINDLSRVMGIDIRAFHTLLHKGYKRAEL
jgi:hypothetical protein